MWQPDIYEGFESRTINLADEDDGELVATVVRRRVEPPAGRCVLYVHGFSDYFFHPHLATEYTDRGINFYAIDLRRCGRSNRTGNRRNYFDAVADFDVEIAEAIKIATEEDANKHLILHGHSMGGLISALFVANHPDGGTVDLLALNSPWVDVNLPLTQKLMWWVTRRLGHRFPHKAVAGGTSHYIDSIHEDQQGEWAFDLAWKPRVGEVVYPGWARAVALGHAELHGGLDISAPVLVQHSDRSISDAEWHDDLMVTDAVLDVDQIHRWAPAFGPDVTIQTIVGGMHDLALSADPARSQMFDGLFSWIDTHS